jgi:hypothetical protein
VPGVNSDSGLSSATDESLVVSGAAVVNSVSVAGGADDVSGLAVTEGVFVD